MSWLLDTNVLLRLADTQSPDHAVAEAAVGRLLAGGGSFLPAFPSRSGEFEWGRLAPHAPHASPLTSVPKNGNIGA
jgi:hypothetical protein